MLVLSGLTLNQAGYLRQQYELGGHAPVVKWSLSGMAIASTQAAVPKTVQRAVFLGYSAKIRGGEAALAYLGGVSQLDNVAQCRARALRLCSWREPYYVAGLG